MTPRTRSYAPLAALGILAALVVGMSAWAAAASHSRLRARVLDENRTAANIAGRLLAADIRGHLAVVKAIAQRPSLISMLEAGDFEGAATHLRDLRGVDPPLLSATLLDANGRLRARDPADPSVVGADLSQADQFRVVVSSGKEYVSEAFEETALPHAVVIAFAAPVRDASGRTIAQLQSSLPLEELEKILSAIPLGPRALQVFDRSGHALTPPASRQGLQSRFLGHPVVTRALAGRSGTGELRVPGLAGPRLAAYGPVPEFRWAVVAQKPRGAAIQPLGTLAARLGAIAVLIGVAALVGGLAAKRLIQQLAHEREISSMILSSLAEGVVTTSRDGRIVSVNQAMERLSGRRDAEIVGVPYTEAFRLLDGQHTPIPPERMLRTQAIESRAPVASHGFDLMLDTTRGPVPVTVTAAPLFDFQGEVIGGVEVLRDVSHEREVDQLKSSLISTVSHELRTPLTMIRGFAELLGQRELDQESSHQALEQIRVSAERLSRLIDDLLSVSRIESGMSLDLAPVDVADVAMEVIPGFSKDRDITVDLEEGLPPVMADRDKLVQVVTNLVSNAVKYSASESPVRVRAGAESAEVVITVEDEGIGISEEDQSNLFTKFFRSSREEVRRAGGTGLGLYITRRLVEMQSGRIWLKSAVGEGSRFFFSLPTPPEARRSYGSDQALDRG